MIFVWKTPVSTVMFRVGWGERNLFSNFLFVTIGEDSWDFYSEEAHEQHLAGDDMYFLNMVENDWGVRLNWDDGEVVIVVLVFLILLRLYMFF